MAVNSILHLFKIFSFNYQSFTSRSQGNVGHFGWQVVGAIVVVVVEVVLIGAELGLLLNSSIRSPCAVEN